MEGEEGDGGGEVGEGLGEAVQVVCSVVVVITTIIAIIAMIITVITTTTNTNTSTSTTIIIPPNQLLHLPLHLPKQLLTIPPITFPPSIPLNQPHLHLPTNPKIPPPSSHPFYNHLLHL